MIPVIFALACLGAGAGEQYAGEKLCYEFFLFGSLKVGDACLTITPRPEGRGYHAAGTAAPSSLARNFTRVRRVLLTSDMAEDPGTGRLRSSFATRGLWRNAHGCLTTYALAGASWTWTSRCAEPGRGDTSDGPVVVPGAGGAFEEPLAAVYNFRSGMYGEKKDGLTVSLPTLNHDGRGRLILRVLSPGAAGEDPPGTRYRMEITQEGNALGFYFHDIQVWIGDNDIPLKGVIRGVLPVLEVTGEIHRPQR